MAGTGAPQDFALQAVQDTLGRATDVDACQALTTRIDLLLEQASQSFRDHGAAPACREGCSFCCHLRVMVYPHEAIALFRYLRSRIPPEQAQVIRGRLLANAARIARQDEEGRASAGMPCALLVDGRCSAYAVRPSKCAGYHSLDAASCEAALPGSGGSGGAIAHLQGLTYVAAALEEGIDAGLAGLGLGHTRIELHTALAALLRNPGVIERWRGGRAMVKKS